MGEFDDMARDVKNASDAATAQERDKAAAGRQADQARFNCDVKLLADEVQPRLEEAARAFEGSGVPCTIYRNWDDRSRSLNPSLLFKCEGKPTILPQTGGTYTPSGTIVAVMAASGVISVLTGKDRYDRFGSIPIRGEWQNALKLALKQALESYHEHVAEHGRFSR
jgi:hypothetical protein